MRQKSTPPTPDDTPPIANYRTGVRHRLLTAVQPAEVRVDAQFTRATSEDTVRRHVADWANGLGDLVGHRVDYWTPLERGPEADHPHLHVFLWGVCPEVKPRELAAKWKWGSARAYALTVPPSPVAAAYLVRKEARLAKETAEAHAAMLGADKRSMARAELRLRLGVLEPELAHLRAILAGYLDSDRDEPPRVHGGATRPLVGSVLYCTKSLLNPSVPIAYSRGLKFRLKLPPKAD